MWTYLNNDNKYSPPENDLIFITKTGLVHKGWYSDYWKDGVFYTEEIGGEFAPHGYRPDEIIAWTIFPNKQTHKKIKEE